ncbi:MAG: hypothetical protein S4CHLAM20_06040 [Chlamydiia bacterium]|nr:hypothetical protein [Chlamydiia bacterium]
MYLFLDFSKVKDHLSKTVLILCSVQFSLFAMTNYDATTKEEGFMLRRITEFWKDCDYKTVKSEIVSFLKTHENSVFCDQLRGNYGDLLVQEGKYKEALDSYLKISHEKVKKTFLLNKMQCYYELEQYEELISCGHPYLTKMSKELLDRKDEFYFLMAEGYFRNALSMQTKDKKNTYLTKALPLYEKILNSSFNDPTMFALAEIYRLQSTNDKAQSFFLELAKRHPDRKEELLFHAALAQAEFDKPMAIETFTQIISLNGEKSVDSALNRLILYFQEERYDDVIDNYEATTATCSDDKKATLEYIIARSYFAKKIYDKANHHLNQFLSLNEGTSDEKRNALLMQLGAAQYLKDESQYKETLDKLEKHFPEDSELSQAVFIHAMMLKEMGRASEAETKLASLIENKSSFKDEEVLFLEYGLVAYNNDNWELSKNTLSSFVQKYQSSAHAPIAWKYLLSSSLNLLKEHQKMQAPTYTKKDFLADLDSIMLHSEVLDKGEIVECLFLQGKLSYELGNYDDALTHLGKFIYKHFQNDHIAEAHLLTALCHHKKGDSNDMFCAHAEKALSLDPELSKKGALHLELFNVYLHISTKSENSKALINKARDHLYTALSLGETSIKLENKLWLASSYLQDLLTEKGIYLTDGNLPQNQELFNRSFAILEEILIDPATENLRVIDEDKIFLEWEVLRYANLLGRKKQYNKKLNVLRSLVEKQSHKKDWQWQAIQEALFELGKTYEIYGDQNGAFETYTFLSNQQSTKRTFIEEYSKLCSVRLSFNKIALKERTDSNKKVFDILSSLKNIQIQKNAISEPLHLEAALEYAKIRGLVTKDKSPHLKYLFFIGRIKEDFGNREDPMSQKYQEKINGSDSLKSLYSQYMKFINAESLRMEAIIKAKENNNSMSLDLMQKASSLLSSLSKETTSVYLSQRIKESQGLIKKGSLF